MDDSTVGRRDTSSVPHSEERGSVSAILRLNRVKRVNGVHAEMEGEMAVRCTCGGRCAGRPNDRRSTQIPYSIESEELCSSSGDSSDCGGCLQSLSGCRVRLKRAAFRRRRKCGPLARYYQGLPTLLKEHPHKSPHSGHRSDSFGALESL